MSRSLAMVCGILCVALPLGAQSGSAEEKKGTAQVRAAGEITKIDAKKKSVQVRELTTASASSRTREPGEGSGTGRRRTGGSGGIGFPGSGRTPGGGGPVARPSVQKKEYKVFIGNDTVLKFAGADIDFTDLHVGDRITISGTPKGTKGDLDAVTITREY